jgi:hypothetical protein
MDAQTITTRFFQIVIVILGLVGLFYLYRYLFGAGALSSTTLLGPKTNAQVEPTGAITISSSNMPGLYEGGEFSISMWVYVQNWSYRQGRNKHILSIGGNTFDTIRMYLGGNKPQLHIRLHTPSDATPASSAGGAQNSGLIPSDRLDKAAQNALFTNLDTGSALLDSTNQLCDLPELDMQRWVQVTVAVNGKTCDVYLDGKLARSCVLPTHFKVDGGGYNATLLGFGGFGGYIAGVSMYNYAVSPDQVYKSYMAGPAPINDLGAYLQSFFQPQSTINV